MSAATDGMFNREPGFPNLIVTRHPLLRHKVTLLRKRDTPKKIFKELVDEIAMLLAYEVTSDLETETVRVETPLESTTGDIVLGERLTLVPILRAGLGMVDGVLDLIPTMRVGHIGLQRDHDTLEPIDYYFKIPHPLRGERVHRGRPHACDRRLGQRRGDLPQGLRGAEYPHDVHRLGAGGSPAHAGRSSGRARLRRRVGP